MQDNKWNDILLSCRKAEMYAENLTSCTDEEEFKLLLLNYISNEFKIEYQFCDFIEDLININDKLVDLSQQNLKLYKRKNFKLAVENVLLFGIATFIIALKILNII